MASTAKLASLSWRFFTFQFVVALATLLVLFRQHADGVPLIVNVTNESTVATSLPYNKSEWIAFFGSVDTQAAAWSCFPPGRRSNSLDCLVFLHPGYVRAYLPLTQGRGHAVVEVHRVCPLQPHASWCVHPAQGFVVGKEVLVALHARLQQRESIDRPYFAVVRGDGGADTDQPPAEFGTPQAPGTESAKPDEGRRVSAQSTETDDSIPHVNDF